MIIALVHLVSREAVATCATLELKHAGEEFPEDVLPRNFGRAETHYEFVELPRLVNDMVGLQAAAFFDVVLAGGALLPLALRLGAQLVAADAAVEKIFLFIKDEFELFHVQLAFQFIAFVFHML